MKLLISPVKVGELKEIFQAWILDELCESETLLNGAMSRGSLSGMRHI